MLLLLFVATEMATLAADSTFQHQVLLEIVIRQNYLVGTTIGEVWKLQLRDVSLAWHKEKKRG